jgi:LCP family protein required for cell wall assembly
MRRNAWSFWAGVAAGLLLSLTGMLLWWFEPARLLASPGDQLAQAAAPTPTVPTYVLVLGVDERDQVLGSRSDTMMLLRVDGQQVRMLSLPRDTLVDLGEHGEGKLNSAYTYGGVDLAKQVAGDLVGVPVDHYVKVDLSGFRHLVDLMGGVEFDVPRAMHYSDPTDGTLIDLEPGEHEAVIRPARRLDAGEGPGKERTVKVEGGAVGLIIDCRGRPLALPDDSTARVVKLREWHAALGLETE